MRHLPRARGLRHAARIAPSVDAVGARPQIKRIELTTRSDEAVLQTPRERRQADAHEAQLQLDVTLRAHPDVQKVCEEMNARIVSVHPDRATPPALDPADP